MSKNLELKSINKILDKHFFIPSYQRGYRWDSKQVEDLLNDILEFTQNKNKNKNDFYCLQPIVVLKNICEDFDNHEEEYYRVIDGQQRLTTIKIIFTYFNNRFTEEYRKKIFPIIYETRNSNDNNSQKYLDELSKVKSEKNIDFFYMHNTYEVIKKWFSDKQNMINDFESTLLNQVKFIWYQIDEKENEIDVFTRLNIGKIPLTNSELIKALFLLSKLESNSNQSDKILLASQWDSIEYKLRNNTFFSFIYEKEYKKANRIEFIFDLIADNTSINIENLKKDDDKKSYYIFDRLLNNGNCFYQEFKIDENNKKTYTNYEKRVEFLWDKVKTYFRIFEELYTNNTYYHLVGYLVNNGKSIKKITKNFEEKSKNDFFEYLQDEIRKITKYKKDKEFDYNNNYESIKQILFLFNVISTMKIGYTQYPFALHKKQNWTLEHIHAQNSDNIKTDDDKHMVLEEQKKHIQDTDLSNDVDKIINKIKITDEEFEEIENKIYKLYTDDFNIHTLDNMALLTQGDNSSINNGIFPAKRDKIQELDKNGSFIPIGTKNVFLKYYSKNVKETVSWNKTDRLEYLNAIQNILNEYLNNEIKSLIEARQQELDSKTGVKND